MRPYLDNILNVPVSDPDDARKRKILNILLASIAATSILAVLLSTVLIITSRQRYEDVGLILWGGSVTIAGTLLIYGINHYWSGKVAAFSILTFLNVIFAFSDTAQQVTNGRTLFLFTIPIIMASILLTPGSSFIFGAFSSIIISFLAISIGFIPNSPAIIGFFLVALVSWLSARSLESALLELRVINAGLDRVVAERTQELAESLSRERIEAGRNQAILNSIADGVIVFDKNWNAILANPAVKGMLEISLELIVNKNFSELIEHPRLAPQSRGLLRSMMEHGTQPIGFRIEWSEKTISVSAAQVYDNQGQNIGTVIVFRDFTREAEVEKLKSTFVGIVSHELRTPLNAILGYSEMFKEAVYGPMNDKQVNMAERIIKNTQRLLGLINDLLDQARMEAGKLTIHMQAVKPSDLLENLHGLMDKTASDKHLKLTSEIDPDLPDAISGDPARLQQILVNLVSNSIKFTDSGMVHVHFFRQDTNRWGIDVSDTGRGIPAAELPFIFDTFRQVDGAATRSHGGFGLGLSIVKQLINLMNGEIKAQSKPGEGSTFLISLPLLVPEGVSTEWRNT
ncbi:MAG TPA: ATP-binding protein [Anaerolineales bacterium]|nr:ATP-binding protein [Anaerolineales bacterium]